MSRLALRDFALLKEDWYDDEVLYAVAEDTTPMVFAYVPVLIGRCREKSHADDNPLGWVTLTVRKAAALVLDEPAAGQGSDEWFRNRVAMWAALHDGEIVELDGDPADRFRIRLVRFAKYQTPKGSSTDRTRAQRLRAGENHSMGTVGERDGNATGTPWDGAGRRGTYRDRDRDREDSPKEGGRVHAGTTPPNEELAVCLQAVARFATPAELDSWTEQLALHRAANPGAPIECYTNAALKVAAYATEQHSSRLAFGKAWGRFQRDFAWARRDAHDARPPVADAAASSGMAPASIRKLVGLDPA